MKAFLVLLFCSSLVFAKPTNEDNETCKKCLSFVDGNYEKIENHLELVKHVLKAYCDVLFMSDKETCYDEVNTQVDGYFNKIKSQYSARKICSSLKLCSSNEELILIDTTTNNPTQKNIFFQLPVIKNVVRSIWDKIACSQCHIYHNYLHEAFKNADYKKRYLELGERLCPDKECVKKLKALVKAISENTDVKKACKPVCQVKETELLSINEVESPKETIFFNFPNVAKNLMSIWDKISCEQCHTYHKFLHEAFKNAAFREYYLAVGLQLCPDKDCVKKLEALVKSITKETDEKKACKPVCQVKETELLSINEVESPKELIFFNFPNVTKNLISIWDKIACSQCHTYHKFLHEAFKNAAFREYYLATGRKLCIDNDCVKKLEALVKAITKETDERKACKPVCDF